MKRLRQGVQGHRFIRGVTCLQSSEPHVGKEEVVRLANLLPQGALDVFSSDHYAMSQVGKPVLSLTPLLSQLLPHIPPMVASLLKEDSNSGASCLEQLAELVHCMVFRFPGFPDLYEPIMEAIKVSDNSPCSLAPL